MEIDEEDQEQLDEILGNREQLAAAVTQIEQQKKQLDQRKDNLLEQYQELNNKLNSKLNEIERVYEVDDNYSYDRVSGELIKGD